MLIIGCDYHPSFQQIALVDTESGELQERRLKHRDEAERGDWQFVCTGCGARDGTTSSGRSSVRTWDSPEIAMVCGRTPSN